MASFILMKKHGFDILKAMCWKGGETKLDMKYGFADLALQNISEENRNVQDEGKTPNQRV